MEVCSDSDIEFKKEYEFRCRTSPAGLFKLVRGLSEDKKHDVRQIGLGSLLLLDIRECPASIGLYIVSQFDYIQRALVIEKNGKVFLDEDDVKAVLDLPQGNLEIIEAKDHDEEATPEYIDFLHAWRRRWGIEEHSGAPIASALLKSLIGREDVGDDFKVDFVVYVVTSFLWTTQNPQCRFKILRSLMDVNEIINLNWCRFVLEGAIYSVMKWQKSTKIPYFSDL